VNGVSTEWLETREDEIAATLTALDDVEEFRFVLRLVHKQNGISPALYQDLTRRLDRIAAALQTGKKNTAIFRNGGNR